MNQPQYNVYSLSIVFTYHIKGLCLIDIQTLFKTKQNKILNLKMTNFSNILSLIRFMYLHFWRWKIRFVHYLLRKFVRGVMVTARIFVVPYSRIKTMNIKHR